MSYLHMIKFYLRPAIKRVMKNEKGAMTIEYIAIGILSLALIAAIAKYLGDSGGSTVGTAFGKTVEAIMTKIQNEVK
ncbi:hypothetical protein [Thermincola potens]|uniref:Uncharacterized protein n=1 Tax=Thermincola potens (strain JR) TaxID=635013 RepID=D5XAH3_THEPJ|nr:hypothetical protein [Thermincola potens]ADG81272.1 conserved hypothetical protein [Thermincola potens JR]